MSDLERDLDTVSVDVPVAVAVRDHVADREGVLVGVIVNVDRYVAEYDMVGVTVNENDRQ